MRRRWEQDQMEHRLASSRVVTDEELERDAEMWENDTWDEEFVDIRIVDRGDPPTVSAFKRCDPGIPDAPLGDPNPDSPGEKA